MTDLETQLSDALQHAAADAPHVTDLAAGARSRLRRRRRGTATVVAAALAAIAVPLGASLLGGIGPKVTTPPDEWRTESYRNLTLQVPADWGYGGGTDWCLDTRAVQLARPQVSRPGPVDDVLCDPLYGYGVIFVPVDRRLTIASTSVPDGAFFELVETPSTSAWVVTETREQLDRIVASVEQINGVDPNGCAPGIFSGRQEPGEQVSICRYDGGRLVQSELLSPEDSRAAIEAFRSAPPDLGPSDGLCGDTLPPSISVFGGGLEAEFILECGSLHVDGARRQFTEDALYWALSPGWSGETAEDLPLPDPMRALD